MFEEAAAAAEPLNEPTRLMWRYFSKNGGTRCSDIFDKISNTDVVEVFNSEQQLCFVNFNFFEHVSFTLEQIFYMTWHHATKRDPAIQQRLLETSRRILAGEIRQTFDPGIPGHLVEEVDTQLLLKYQIHMKWASPVFTESKNSGFIVVLEVRNAAKQNS